ncbi:50S ribosomal protein L31 [[Mycoplasma] testudinis]|uniref:50S ribosomal protein L31 n=1 Tax=[Mycoplasma] testudinis TaxID=33924 RepID=UPI000697D50E|nr:50S ribosomal protein L31 [[Mycoplasma] testudinis]
MEKPTTKKQGHPAMHEVSFTCASCNANYKITSTLKTTETGLDICSNCHPFYIGSGGQQVVKGRAEKLSSKFEAGKHTAATKPTKPVVKQSPKDNHKAKSLADL